jgi:neutral amino acid transport system permease protein
MDWSQIIENTLRSAVGRDMIIYALAAIGLNIHFGYTGLLNFGQAGFMAVGGYATAISLRHGVLGVELPYLFGIDLDGGVADFVAVVEAVGLGMLAAVAFAVVLGLPTLRLRADYLAIVTIAAAEIFRRVMAVPNLADTTGGADGLSAFADPFHDLNPIPEGTYGFGPWRYGERQAWILLVGWTLVLVAVLVTFLLMRSPWGRVVRAVREDEDAARSLGKNAYGYKMQSLVVGGVMGGLSGIFWALAQSSVLPEFFSTAPTFLAYVALILGGAARVWGPVVGSLILWGLLSFSSGVLSEGVTEGYIPDWLMNDTQVGQVRFILVGLGLALLAIFRPQGIFGDRREISLEPQ